VNNLFGFSRDNDVGGLAKPIISTKSSNSNDKNLDRIINACSKYISDSSCVYKTCRDIKNELSYWLIVLQKLAGTLTNEHRDNVIDENYAKFRGDKFKVVDIINIDDPSVTTKSIVNKYDDILTEYIIGKVVYPDKYNDDINVIATHGIHYFKSLIAAYLYRAVPENYTGPWVDYHPNGQKQIEHQYVNGIKTGIQTSFFQNGHKLSEGKFENGQKSGLWTYWYSDGDKQLEGNYLNGFETGCWKRWHNKKQLSAEGTYENGQKIGLWTYWWPHGQTESEGYYVNGMKNGGWTYWFAEEKISSQGAYENDEKTGSWIEYFPNGEIGSIGQYAYGKKVGLWKFWYGNGKIYADGVYVNNARVGIWTIWSTDGQQKYVDYNKPR
jgi:antitoxin component YwqK of YwqJK toxin-antitoxin module